MWRLSKKAFSHQLSAFWRTFPATGMSNVRYVVAAGGRIIIPPYPAADELGGIYRTKYARGVDTREVKSYIR
jgi:hypothetical protein